MTLTVPGLQDPGRAQGGRDQGGGKHNQTAWNFVFLTDCFEIKNCESRPRFGSEVKTKD